MPRRGRGLSPLARGKLIHQEGHDGEQGEQARRGARDGLVGPPPLRLDAKARADLLEGDLHPPAPRRLRRRSGPGPGRGRCRAAPEARGVPGRHDGRTAVPPHGGRRGDLDRAIARAARGPSPAPCATPRPWRRGRRTRWADARPSSAGGRSRPGRAGRRGLTERRVGCRAGDGGDAAAARGVEDGQGFEAAAGDAREIAARPASGAPDGPSAARPRGVTRAADPAWLRGVRRGRAPSGRAAPGPARPKGWGRRAMRLHRAAARSSRRGGRPTSARGRDRCPWPGCDAPGGARWCRRRPRPGDRSARRRRRDASAGSVRPVRGHQAARPSARWWLAKGRSCERPVIRSTPVTVRPARRRRRADPEHLGAAPGALDDERRDGPDDPHEAGGPMRHGASPGGDAATRPAAPASSPAPAHQPAPPEWPKSCSEPATNSLRGVGAP